MKNKHTAILEAYNNAWNNPSGQNIKRYDRVKHFLLKTLERQEADHKAEVRKMVEVLRLNKRYPTEHSNLDSELLCAGWNQAVDEFNTKLDTLLKEL